VSDIKLFRTAGSVVSELAGGAVALEKSLQTLFEANLDNLLGVRFLASEFAITEGRIDTLGIDENYSPVVIEYKRSSNENVINQSLMMRATIYRQLGDVKRAQNMLSELEPRWRRMMPAGNMAFASLASEQAVLAQTAGDLRAATAASDRAIAIAEASPQRIDYLPAILLRRSNIDLQSDRLQDARLRAETALRMERDAGEAGVFSSRIGRAHLALGRALQAEGRIGDAHAAFRSAAEHLAPSLGADHPDTREARRRAAETAGS